MNFSQLQERVRLELQRRIERGTLSVSLLARLTGLGQGHMSNFLHGRRQLSLRTLDKIMKAQHLAVADLLPARRDGWGELLSGQRGETLEVPLVSNEVAAFEPYISASKVQAMLPFPAMELTGLRERCTASRRQWARFVAIRMSAADAAPMTPVVRAEALVILDRHYNSFTAYRGDAANVFAVRRGAQLVVRYADHLASRVVLRAHDPGFAAELLEIEPGQVANDLLVGRVGLVVQAL